MNRDVTRPVLLRPPVRFFDSTSDFSGRLLVMSSRETDVWKRRVGVVGLYVLIGISFPLNLREVRHLLARLQLHVRLLPVRTVAGETAAPAQLASNVRGADFVHLHLEQLLDRPLTWSCWRPACTSKHSVRSLSFLVDALLGHERAPDHFIDGSFCQRLREFPRGGFAEAARARGPAGGTAFTSRRGQQRHALQVAQPQRQVAVLAVVHHQHRAVGFELGQRRAIALLVLWSAKVNACTTFNSPSRTLAESAERSAPSSIFLRQLVAVIARSRPVHRAAVPPQRRADRTHARPAGALLLPQLLARAGTSARTLVLCVPARCPPG